MDDSANSDANITEDERSSGKRKLDEASGGEDFSNEEGFLTGRVTRMRVSETADKNGGASGGVNAGDLSELTTDSKATPNHQKHGTPSSALPPNGPANEDLGDGPLNPSLGGNPHASGPGHVGPPETPSPFEATPGSLLLPSSMEAAPASFSFPFLSEAPHASTAPSVYNGASLSESVLPPSDFVGDRPIHGQLNVFSSLPLQTAFVSDTNAHSDDQQLESGAFQGLSPVRVHEGSQDGAVLPSDTSGALVGLGLELSRGQTATTDGETPSDHEMVDAFAGSGNIPGGALEETAAQERASEPELQDLGPTASAVPSVVSATPALEAEQVDEEAGATLDEMTLDLSNYPSAIFEDVVMGGEVSGEADIGTTRDEANTGSIIGDDVSMGEIACDDVRADDIECDDVDGRDGDVSRRAAEEEQGASEQCRCAELASGAAQLQLLVKLFDGRMVLVRADPSEGAEAVLEKVRIKTGVDCVGQRLLYNGRELPPDAPLAMFALESGCTLTLAARLRSSAVPWAFTLTERLLHYAKVALDPGEKLGRREVAANTVTHQVAGLLENARHLRAKAADSEWGAAKAGVVDVFRTMGGPRMLHALLQSPDAFCRRCAEDCIHGFVTEVQTDYLFTRGRLGLYCLPVLTDVWTALLSDDSDHVRETYEEVTSALLATLAGKSQWLLRDYFRLSKQGALDFFVGMLERVKDRLCALTTTLTDVYTEEGHSYHAWLQPLPEAKTFGVLCHVVVSAMQSAADEIIHWFDVAEIAPGGERQYTRAAWEGGGVWSRLGEAYARVQRVLDPGFYADVAAWWGATSAALWEGVLTDDPQSTREQVFLARVTLDDSARSQVNGVLGERIYHVLDGLAAFNFGGPQSPFFERFEALLTGHESEIDAIALACPENKAWMFDAPARRHLASRTRVAWFLKQFPEPEEGGPRVEIIVPRGATLLPETLSMIGDEETNDLSKLQRGLGVVFDGEEAEGPGVLREWFALVARELFSEEKGLFLAAPEDKRRVFPNPASGEAFGSGRCKRHLEYMRLAGHVLGLAILHRVPLGVLLSTAFYKALARQPLSWADARDISPDLYNSCKAVLDLPPGDVEALGLTFSADVIQNGAISTVDLVAGGGDVAVTGDNRADYIDRLVNYRLLTQAEPQLGAFHQGLSVIITGTQSLERALTIVGQTELEEILESASPEIDVRDWILHTEYSGYTPECDQVRWFWRVVEEMTSEQRRRLLYFATAVAHLPLSGFSALPHAFRLHRAYVDLDWLPTAHTCFHLFMLPPYSSYEMMRSRLLMVTQDHVVEGFGFV